MLSQGPTCGFLTALLLAVFLVATSSVHAQVLNSPEVLQLRQESDASEADWWRGIFEGAHQFSSSDSQGSILDWPNDLLVFAHDDPVLSGYAEVSAARTSDGYEYGLSSPAVTFAGIGVQATAGRQAFDTDGPFGLGVVCDGDASGPPRAFYYCQDTNTHDSEFFKTTDVHIHHDQFRPMAPGLIGRSYWNWTAVWYEPADDITYSVNLTRGLSATPEDWFGDPMTNRSDDAARAFVDLTRHMVHVNLADTLPVPADT